jgi:hypothetical protein
MPRATPVLPWPGWRNDRAHSKPAATDRVANMHAFAAAALDLLAEVVAAVPC